jgi:two-component system, sensor histidine kinase LadS
MTIDSQRASVSRAGALSALRHRYALAGALSSLALPATLPFVRVLTEPGPFGLAALVADVQGATATYAWVALGSLVLMAGLGWALGARGEEARGFAITDPLTGLFNRRHFASQLSSEMLRDRRQGQPTCVMCVDLDRLKAINDRFGHDRGDAALVTVAEALSGGCRRDDVVARLGGDEFAVVLPNTTGEHAVSIGERIVTALKRDTLVATAGLSVSIGIAELEHAATAGELLAAADRALYWVKSTGGGRVSLAPRAVISEPIAAASAGG